MRCVLSKTTTDLHKSKIKSNELAELVIECYIPPRTFAEIIEKYSEREFELTIK